MQCYDYEQGKFSKWIESGILMAKKYCNSPGNRSSGSSSRQLQPERFGEERARLPARVVGGAERDNETDHLNLLAATREGHQFYWVRSGSCY